MSDKISNVDAFDREYREWIKNISSRFRQSQIKAATHVNEEMLRFYWTLGRDIVLMINRRTLVTLVMSKAVFTDGKQPYKRPDRTVHSCDKTGMPQTGTI